MRALPFKPCKEVQIGRCEPQLLLSDHVFMQSNGSGRGGPRVLKPRSNLMTEVTLGRITQTGFPVCLPH